MAQAMTEGVYATGTEKAIVRSSSTKSLPYTPSGTFGATSPYTGEANSEVRTRFHRVKAPLCRGSCHGASHD